MQNQLTVEAVRALRSHTPLNTFSGQYVGTSSSSTKTTAAKSATSEQKKEDKREDKSSSDGILGGTAPVSGCALPPLWTRHPIQIDQTGQKRKLLNPSCLSLDTLHDSNGAGVGGAGWISAPPKVALITHPKKGRCLVATKTIEQGETVFVDTSELTVPTEAKVFDRLNALQPSAIQQRTMKRDPEIAKYYQEEEAAVLADCSIILRKAVTVFGEELLQSKGLQCLLSLIAQCGDTLALAPPSRATVNIESQVMSVHLEKERRAGKQNRAVATALQDDEKTTGGNAEPHQTDAAANKKKKQKKGGVVFRDALDRFRGEQQQKSDNVCRMVDRWMEDWCHHLATASPTADNNNHVNGGGEKKQGNKNEEEVSDSTCRTEKERKKKREDLLWEQQWRSVADAVLSCVPEDYLYIGLDPGDLVTAGEAVIANDKRKIRKAAAAAATLDNSQQPTTTGDADQEEDDNDEEEEEGEDEEVAAPGARRRREVGEVEVQMGFLARVGLSTVEDLVQFFAIVDANYTEIHVPGLETRLALFPLIRYLEHECRPNTVIAFLDNLDSHSDERQENPEEKIVHPDDPYGDNPESVSKELKRISSVRKGVSRDYLSRRILSPSTAMVTATRKIEHGESISVSYIPSTYMIQPQRQMELLQRHRFQCVCKWCTTEPDLARAFKCSRCEKNQGVVCPTGDGTKFDQWICLQCGWIPDIAFIHRCFDAEKSLGALKAIPGSHNQSMVKLLGDEYMHYTHATVFRKCDEWSEKAWKDQDASMCLNYIETLIKCADRVLPPGDPARAQYREFHGQLHHALGNAHTSRGEYQEALRLREAAGHQLTYWCARTRFMALEKSLANLMDSK